MPRWFAPVALALITALAAFLRYWQLDTTPPGFHYDEAYEALEAWRVLTQPSYRPVFFTGNFGVDPMFIYLTAIAFRLFGAAPEVMRGVGAAVGTITVPALYLLAREWMRRDRRLPPALPLLAALALAIQRWHITFSRMGIEPILVPLFLVLLLWAFARAVRTGSRWAWIGFGLAAGLGAATYPAGRLLPVLAAGLGVVGLVLAWRAGRRTMNSPALPLKATFRGLLLAAAVAVLVYAPLGIHFIQHPDQLILRSSQIAVAPGVEAVTTGGPLRNFFAALGMFSLRGDADPRSNVPGLPVLDVLMSIPFIMGVVWLAWRGRRLTGIIWWLAFAVMLAPTVFSDYAPHFRRAVGLAPLVALASGLGLAVILGRAGSHPATAPGAVPARLQGSGVPAEQVAADMDRLRRVGRGVVVAAIVVGSLVYSATAYFGTWGRSAVLYYAYDQGLWEIGQYVLGLPPDERVYVSPRPTSDTTLGFAWREGRPVRHFDGRHVFVAPEQGTGVATYIIIEYEDFRGWRVLGELYPGRREVRQFLDRTGQVYARAYRVDGGQPPARGPRHPVDAAVASWPGFALVGYDTDRAVYQPGQLVYLQLWWRADAPVSTDWTVFTHLLGPARADGSSLWVGQDARPGQGSAPMTTWAPGDLVLDEYQWPLPADAPPGEYQIEIGVYDPAQSDQRGLTAGGADHVIVGTLRIE
jgi:4-amino-4-deoxy-L-arabinose transferase-like glycosyltransferase